MDSEKKQNEREVRQKQSEARHNKDMEERCRKEPTSLTKTFLDPTHAKMLGF